MSEPNLKDMTSIKLIDKTGLTPTKVGVNLYLYISSSFLLFLLISLPLLFIAVLKQLLFSMHTHSAAISYNQLLTMAQIIILETVVFKIGIKIK